MDGNTSENLLNFSTAGIYSAVAKCSKLPTSQAPENENNPFDLALHKVEQFGDPFEAPPLSVGRLSAGTAVGKLIDFGDSPCVVTSTTTTTTNDKENRNDLNSNKNCVRSNSSSPQSPASKVKTGKKEHPNLLKMSVANVAAAAGKVVTSDDPNLNKISDKWNKMLNGTANDSCQDIMNQEINLVESFDTDISDIELDLQIPMLEKIKSTESPEDKANNLEPLLKKFREIKENTSNKTDEMKLVASKLKELAKNDSEVYELADKLCITLDKSDGNLDAPLPSPLCRQGTFEFEKPKSSNDVSPAPSMSSDTSDTVQSIVEQLSRALGNINLNVVSASEPNPVAPTIIVVVNQSEPAHVFEPLEVPRTPPPASRYTQMFGSARRQSISHMDTPTTSYKRRSSMFHTPIATRTSTPVIQTPHAIVRPNNSHPLNAKTGFLDKLKPKLGIGGGAGTRHTTTTTAGPLKATVPLKAVVKPTKLVPPATPSAAAKYAPRASLTPAKPRNSMAMTKPVTPVPQRTSVNLQNRKSLLPPKAKSVGTLTERKFPATPSSSSSSFIRPSTTKTVRK